MPDHISEAMRELQAITERVEKLKGRTLGPDGCPRTEAEMAADIERKYMALAATPLELPKASKWETFGKALEQVLVKTMTACPSGRQQPGECSRFRPCSACAAADAVRRAMRR